MRRPAFLVFVLLGGWACAGGRIEGSTFYSDKGYRARLPLSGWRIVSAGGADLVLKQPEWGAGIRLHATCDEGAPRRPLSVLARHLTFGMREKRLLEQGEVTLTGLPALRVLLQGRLDDTPVTVEAYVLQDGVCVYDLMYVAPPSEFSRGTADFHAFVSSFERP